MPESAFGMGGFNNSHYFLLPLFDLKVVSSSLFRNNYVGTYIQDAGRICHIENPLFVVFRFRTLDSQVYRAISDYFASLPEYKFSYYAGHNDGSLITFVLKAKEEDVECYKQIVSGKYSHTPAWYVNRCRTFPFPPSTRKRLQGICLKEDWHKEELEEILDVRLEGELWNEFEDQREVYRYVKKKEINPPHLD